MNPQAQELNEAIASVNPYIGKLLSAKGREIFFPRLGILAQSAAAKGKRINATIGIAVEDDGSPMRFPSIASLVKLPPDRVFPYAPSEGRPDMRKKWQEALYRKNPGLSGRAVSLPVTTLALTHGIYTAGYLFVDPGDEIIVPDLYWENYDLVLGHGYGARFVHYPLFAGGGFNVDGFARALEGGSAPAEARKGVGNAGKKIVLLNFPNNPTGYTPTVGEAEAIRDVIKKAASCCEGIVVILDDAYFGLVYEEGILAESMFSSLSDLDSKVLAVKLDGPTKEQYVWGFRVGFITFGVRSGTKTLYDALEAKAAGAVRGSISCAPNISQSLVFAALDDPGYEAVRHEKYAILRDRYREVRRILAAHPEYHSFFEPLPFNSGYFMCVKLRDDLDAERVRQLLLSSYDTGVIAGKSILRLAFSAVSISLLRDLFENIYHACADSLK
jgi:aspartate/methionine/tyrosine aminotransferase